MYVYLNHINQHMEAWGHRIVWVSVTTAYTILPGKYNKLPVIPIIVRAFLQNDMTKVLVIEPEQVICRVTDIPNARGIHDELPFIRESAPYKSWVLSIGRFILRRHIKAE